MAAYARELDHLSNKAISKIRQRRRRCLSLYFPSPPPYNPYCLTAKVRSRTPLSEKETADKAKVAADSAELIASGNICVLPSIRIPSPFLSRSQDGPKVLRYSSSAMRRSSRLDPVAEIARTPDRRFATTTYGSLILSRCRSQRKVKVPRDETRYTRKTHMLRYVINLTKRYYNILHNIRKN